MFAGWITFSAERAGETTIVRAHVLMRANGPLCELGMTFGTLQTLAAPLHRRSRTAA
jgi:hypothetical protein